MTNLEALVYSTAILVSALYATALNRNHEWSPNWTWLTVVIGVGYTLMLTAIIVLSQPTTGPQALIHTVLMFMATGGPIILWQIRLLEMRLDQFADYYRRQRRHGRQTETTAEAESGVQKTARD